MGRSARGVTGIKFKKENDCVLTMTTISDKDTLLTVSTKGFGKRTSAEEYTASKNRAGSGFTFYKPTERTGVVAGCISFNGTEDILITTSNGIVIRIPSNNISSMSKNAAGVRLINLNEGDTIASIATIVSDNEEVVNE